VGPRKGGSLNKEKNKKFESLLRKKRKIGRRGWGGKREGGEKTGVKKGQLAVHPEDSLKGKGSETQSFGENEEKAYRGCGPSPPGCKENQ